MFSSDFLPVYCTGIYPGNNMGPPAHLNSRPGTSLTNTMAMKRLHDSIFQKFWFFLTYNRLHINHRIVTHKT
jgi:hypothetical protein